jgi:hypothetical protein
MNEILAFICQGKKEEAPVVSNSSIVLSRTIRINFTTPSITIDWPACLKQWGILNVFFFYYNEPIYDYIQLFKTLRFFSPAFGVEPPSLLRLMPQA